MKIRYLLVTFFSLYLFIIEGCTSKTTSYITGISLLSSKKKEPLDTPTNKVLLALAKEIQSRSKDTQLTVNKHLSKSTKKQKLSLHLTPTYLKITFPNQIMFSKDSTIIRKKSKKTIQSLLISLKSYPEIIIQIIGHAYKEGKQKQMQHLSDYRAIAVAELLFNNGLQQDILAKGCSNFVPLKKCPNQMDSLCQAQNRNVDIFIYSNKNDVITKCR